MIDEAKVHAILMKRYKKFLRDYEVYIIGWAQLPVPKASFGVCYYVVEKGWSTLENESSITIKFYEGFYLRDSTFHEVPMTEEECMQLAKKDYKKTLSQRSISKLMVFRL